MRSALTVPCHVARIIAGLRRPGVEHPTDAELMRYASEDTSPVPACDLHARATPRGPRYRHRVTGTSVRVHSSHASPAARMGAATPAVTALLVAVLFIASCLGEALLPRCLAPTDGGSKPSPPRTPKPRQRRACRCKPDTPWSPRSAARPQPPKKPDPPQPPHTTRPKPRVPKRPHKPPPPGPPPPPLTDGGCLWCVCSKGGVEVAFCEEGCKGRQCKPHNFCPKYDCDTCTCRGTCRPC